MILTLDFASDIPIYQQIRNDVVKAIASGQFQEGERLPTVRGLAQEAGINTMTVNKAYQLLKQEGYIITDRRNGAMVHCKDEPDKARLRKLKKDLELIVAEAKLNQISQPELTALLDEIYRR